MRPHPILSTLLAAMAAVTANAAAADRTASGKGGEPGDTRPTPALEEVILVYKSHFDIGYTHLISEVIERYRTKTIEDALAVVDRNKGLPPEQQFVWTIPGWPMKTILEDWPGQTDERRRRVAEAFRAGRIAVHALPFTTHTELIEPEGLVRGMGFASQLARESGHPLPTGAKMTDVPEHTRLLPTVLKHAGVTFLHLGCNPASATPEVPFLFWWEGPDGSRVLTMYSALYGSDLLPPADWKHKTWLAMVTAGDNLPPPDPATVVRQIHHIKQRHPGVTVRIGTLSDFANRMAAENLDDLPVVTADMPDTWIHGAMCDPAGVALNRRATPNILAAESLGTLLGSWGGTARAHARTIADAYENSLLYYEHTWGGAMSWIGNYTAVVNHNGTCENWGYGDTWRKNLAAGRFDRSIRSWEEKSDFARHADRFASTTLEENLKTLAASVPAAGPATVVFNPLPWKRDAVVHGRLVKDIPAGGYTTVPRTPSAPVAQPATNTLENGRFKITVDPAFGTITSIIDKRGGRELVDAGADHGFGAYLQEKFSAAEVSDYCKSYIRGGHLWGYVEIGKPNLPPASEVPYRAATAGSFRVAAEFAADTRSLVMTSTPEHDGVNHPVTTVVRLAGDAPYVELEMTIEKPADPWPEAGWICLPFKAAEPRFQVGRNGFLMDPARDIIPGSNRHLYTVGTGVAVISADGAGAAVCGPDTPLVSLGEPGMWKFSRDYMPAKPAVYFNLYNNQWSTNFRFWNEGKWTYRFRIWAFDGFEPGSSLVTPALETRHPVVTAEVPAAAHPPARPLPPAQPGVAVSRPGVMVTAFGANPDGAGNLLRLWETTGQSGDLTVTLPGGWTSATPVNLRGEKTGDPLAIRDGKLTFTLSAYAPASFVLGAR